MGTSDRSGRHSGTSDSGGKGLQTEVRRRLIRSPTKGSGTLGLSRTADLAHSGDNHGLRGFGPRFLLAAAMP